MFSGTPILTDVGKTLLLRAANGESFRLTHFQVGNGILEENETEAGMTALKRSVLENVAITGPGQGPSAEVVTNENGQKYVEVQAKFDNSTIAEEFDWTELGLIAEDEDHNEYLYAYGYERYASERIRPAGSSVVLEETIELFIVIDDAANISAAILPTATYASKAEFDQHKADFEEHLNDRENPHHVLWSDTGAAKAEHNHNANNITAGILPVERGGTGVNSLDQLAQALETNFKVGFVTGNGNENNTIWQDVDVGFTPSRVMLMKWTPGGTGASTLTMCCFELGKNQYHSGCGSSMLTASVESLKARGHGGAAIIHNGFTMSNGGSSRSDLNSNGQVYMYIAFR